MILARRNSVLGIAFTAALCVYPWGALRCEQKAENLTPEQILDHMERSEAERTAALRNYTVVRHYTLSTRRFDQYAEMLARLTFTAPGTKSFEVMWQKGTGIFQNRAFHTIMNAEVEAARDDVREQIRLDRGNYNFRLLGTDVHNGRPAYVFEMTPKTKRKFQLEGRLWIDMEEFAIVRLEGVPVAKPSWWLRKMHMIQEYRKEGRFWLLDTIQSDSEVRLIGEAHLKIEFLDYEINRAPEQRRASVRP